MRKLLSLALLFGLTLGAEAQSLISIIPLDTTSKFTINFVANGRAKYDVANYKILYQTPDVDGNPSTASGLMSVPLVACDSIGIVLYDHGTVLERDDVPSRNNFESIIGKVFASRGYVCVMPDYLGLGDSPGLHPYVHAETEATASIDMMRAVREALADSIASYNLNSELFITGYSQGGHAAMATAKYIQDNNLETEFNVVGAAPASGPYNLAGSQASVFINNQPYSNPGYVVYLLLGMNHAYGGIFFSNPSEILKAPYDVIIPPYFDGTYPMDSVNSKLPSRVRDYLEDSVVQAFVDDTVNQQHWLWTILNDNSNHDWRPNTKLRMYYCTNDEQVNYQNALDAYAAMTAKGATDVHAIGRGAFNHGGCVAPSIESAVYFFDSLSTSCSSFVGLLDQDIASYEIYPNPVHTELKIKGIGEQANILIYDLNGRLVLEQKASFQTRLGLSELNKGIYLLEIQEGQRRTRQRIMKN
ncbi:T9SS type A sorting domain-containing protein [Croceimicrobium hydrocarbonivorans]|uniref:Alpha/beta fold hydrolase n=1 Tax=Croceimicrobium hydrocarbonivorans TaxID=2761580 RepID=A0A7H0VI54_9FLAO|nr:alpha/beta fold hydrolase [Croceimicrobium hydrocarbonivorans]QNR25402.1 alpha/beta fold hydrolase [Croceimicrobium hydrocarbonivorans]